MLINLLIFFAVLSVLIFFHELGHFVAAKLCGIYVKRFSIGMPPRVFGIQVGDTDYCVGALPFGGFVMMAGQEDVPLSDEEREQEYGQVPEHRWFRNKPVYQRLFVLVMGPVMNLVLAVMLYAALAMMGDLVPEWQTTPVVGEVEADSPAVMAPLYRITNDTIPDLTGAPDATGWQTGDLILSVDGKSIDNIGNLAAVAMLHGADTPHDIRLARETAPGVKDTYFCRLAPIKLGKEGRPRFGVAPFETALVGEGLRPDWPGVVAGLKAGDIIYSANGKRVSRSGFIKAMEDTPENGSVGLKVLRNGALIDMTVQPRTLGRVRGLAYGWNDKKDPTRAEVVMVSEDMAAFSGIGPRDVITRVNGEPATQETFQKLEEAQPGGRLTLMVERPARFFGLGAQSGLFEATVPVDAVRALGVPLEARMVLQKFSPVAAIPEAFRTSYNDVAQTLLTLKGIFTMTVSPKDLGGPLMIYDVTTKAAEAGLGWLIRITAFISINLFVFNLLPLPVLDGGQIVTNAIEAVRGKPLNEAFLERFQQAGLFLLLALMVYVTFNDIMRKIGGSIL